MYASAPTSGTYLRFPPQLRLVLFHNREKPKTKKLNVSALYNEGKRCSDGIPIEIGGDYEAADSKGNWHPVKIKSKNADGTYVAYVQDDGNTWDVVVPFWIRTRSELTEEAKVALEKVFKRYSEGSA